MNITFYMNNSPVSTLFPVITQVGNTIDITPFNAVSVTNPDIIIDYSETIQAANYCKISWVESGLLNEMWYFCKFTTGNGRRLIVSCERDPLYSFRNAILKCPITVVRNGGIGKPTKITDTKLPVLTSEQELKQTTASNSAIGVNSLHKYIITVIGGEVNNGN